MAVDYWPTEPLPPGTVEAVRVAVPPLVEGVVAAVRSENPVYADVLEGPEGVGIRLGIEQAIATFLEAVEHGHPPARETAEVWRRLGEAEFQAGRSLDALRAAFRTGTRAAWRGAAELAAEAGVPARIVITLAETVFVYSDELAADVVEGYLRMQSDEAGERERRRRRLAALLLDDEAHDPEAIERAAELARWPLPQTLAVLTLEGEATGSITRRLGGEALVGADASGSWLLIPDPDGPRRPALLERAVAGRDCALGPTVSTRDAHRSLRLSRLTLELVKRGALPSQHPTRTEDHLPAVIVLQDGDLADALVSKSLAPLEDLPEAERDRLLQTLSAWLAHQRHTPKISQELHVHPQTVRYRIGRVRELIGGILDTPAGRFELELALRARAAREQ